MTDEAKPRECASCGGEGGYTEQDPCAGPQWYCCSYCNGTGVIQPLPASRKEGGSDG